LSVLTHMGRGISKIKVIQGERGKRLISSLKGVGVGIQSGNANLEKRHSQVSAARIIGEEYSLRIGWFGREDQWDKQREKGGETLHPWTFRRRIIISILAGGNEGEKGVEKYFLLSGGCRRGPVAAMGQRECKGIDAGGN